MPEEIYKRDCTSAERKEHEGAAAKWDRLALNVVTQGESLPWLNSSNSVNPEMGIPSQVI